MGSGDAGDIEPDRLRRVRAICLALPESYEERAWHGSRWRVGTKTFAHALHVADGPPAFARALGPHAPADVISFRAAPGDIEALVQAGPPLFLGGWGRGQLLVALGPATDWGEVTELVVESYCELAPRRLADQVRPIPGHAPPTTPHYP